MITEARIHDTFVPKMPDINVGDTVDDSEGKSYRVVKKNIGEGFHSHVHLLEKITPTPVPSHSKVNTLYVLKQPKYHANNRELTLRHIHSIKEEVETLVPRWKEAGAVDQSFEAYVDESGLGNIKTFIQGVSGREAMLNPEFWSHESTQKKQLISLFQSFIEQSLFIGDLAPDNFIYDGERFQVIDSGGIKGMSSQYAAAMLYKGVDVDAQEKNYFTGKSLEVKWSKFVVRLSASEIASVLNKSQSEITSADRSTVKNLFNRLLKEITAPYLKPVK